MTDANCILPFQIDASSLRGRMVRLEGELSAIVTRHAYPAPVAHLLGETLCVAALLGDMLKYDGIFTLQVKGDGPISMLVADITSAGHMRAYARFDADRLPPTEIAPLSALLGKGVLAFTVDQGEDSERYQGLVELTGDTLADCIHHYFKQSEQLLTGFKTCVRKTEMGWQAGGIMLQRLPPMDAGRFVEQDTDDADAWRRAMVLLQTVTPDELANPALSSETILFRLFHEDGIRVYDARPLKDQCRCSADRVAAVVKTLSAEDRADIAVDGKIAITCEFCNQTYAVDAS